MKFLILLLILISSVSYSNTEIYLSEANYYLDDFNQNITPEIGLEFKGFSLEGKLTDDFFFGSGYVRQFSDYGGTESLNGWYSEIIYKVDYQVTPEIKITAGAGWIDNRETYAGGLDNHINLGLQYKIK